MIHYFSRTICCLLVVILSGCDESSPTDGAKGPSRSAGRNSLLVKKNRLDATPFISAGLKEPKTFTADEVDLSDHVEVIGITVGTTARAYALNDLTPMTSHVVNDVLGNSAVSVTYCDRSNFSRVFTNSKAGKPIDLFTGGWHDHAMLLMLDGTFFSQKAKDLPLEEHPHQRMSWGEWKLLHPATTIYVSKQQASMHHAPL